MYFKTILTLFVCVLYLNTHAQLAQNSLLNNPAAYFGQKVPGSKPEEFASQHLKVKGKQYQNSSFSPDGKEFLYNVFDVQLNTYTLYQTNYTNSRWTVPTSAVFVENLKNKLMYEPRHHPNGKILYLVADGELYYSEKMGNKWSDAKKLEDAINIPNTEHPSFDSNNTLYFWSRREGNDDLYKAVLEKGKYSTISNLGVPVNSKSFDADPYISPDGQYLIFTSNRGMTTATTEGTWQGNGGTDLYISYWKSGKWTSPKNLGTEINQPDVWNYNPLVTPDGKYFIFGRRKMGPDGFSKLCWMSTNFIDSLRHTNFEPYVNREVADQVARAGEFFFFQLAEDTFVDDDGNNTIKYAANLKNGAALPEWLKFDASSRTFSGTPVEKVKVTIKVTATDRAEASVVSAPFSIEINDR